MTRHALFLLPLLSVACAGSEIDLTAQPLAFAETEPAERVLIPLVAVPTWERSDVDGMPIMTPDPSVDYRIQHAVPDSGVDYTILRADPSLPLRWVAGDTTRLKRELRMREQALKDLHDGSGTDADSGLGVSPPASP